MSQQRESTGSQLAYRLVGSYIVALFVPLSLSVSLASGSVDWLHPTCRLLRSYHTKRAVDSMKSSISSALQLALPGARRKQAP